MNNSKRLISPVYVPNLLISAFAFFVGFGGHFLPLLSVIFIIGWITDVILNKKTLIRDNKNTYYIYIPVLLLFIISVLSLIYSDIDIGLKFLEKRLLLLLFPIMGIIGYSRKLDFKLIIGCFLAGVILSIFYIALEMLIEYFSTDYVKILIRQDLFNYFQEKISLFQHRTYLGINISLSLIILYALFKSDDNKANYKIFLIMGLMVSFAFMTGGRIAALTSAVVFAIILIRSYTRFQNKHSKYILIAIFLILLVFFILFFPRVWELFAHFSNSDEPRFEIWKIALSALKKNWLFGYGIGDFKTEMLRLYHSSGFEEGLKYNLNVHNQFIEYLGESGVLSILLLIWIFIGSVYSSNRKRRIYPIIITFVFVLNFMFESVLLRIWGVTSFVVGIFFINNYINSENTEKINIKRIDIIYYPMIFSYLLIAFLISVSFKTITLNSLDPATYAQSNYTAITKFPGKLPDSFPNNAIGYKLDKDAKPFMYLDYLHRTKILHVRPNECDSVMLSVFCYVSDEFDGENVFLGGYTSNYLVKDDYDLSRKGTWQYLTIKSVCPNFKVDYYLQFANYEEHNISELSGYVIFVSPEIILK
ncbi:O-antigen ligase family protein [Saccharicrinis sp. FJH54]|uniref:O-antigen ligase family protein n=1 Tax=Saccharicrinis sp. FJH54 TaxID=3344665 RepID=UPI0035D41FCF